MALVNLKHNFIFIHVYKTAGNSIRHILKGQEIGESHWTCQQTYNYLKNKGLQCLWHNLLVFAVVRNPFDWMVSLYHYIHDHPDHPDHNTVATMDFSMFLLWHKNIALSPDHHHPYRTQSQFLCDQDGVLMVDKIIHYERLQQGFDAVCSITGMEKKKLPQINVSKNRAVDLSDYYGTWERNILERTLKEDLNKFGYTWKTDLQETPISRKSS